MNTINALPAQAPSRRRRPAPLLRSVGRCVLLVLRAALLLVAKCLEALVQLVPRLLAEPLAWLLLGAFALARADLSAPLLAAWPPG